MSITQNDMPEKFIYIPSVRLPILVKIIAIINKIVVIIDFLIVYIILPLELFYYLIKKGDHNMIL